MQTINKAYSIGSFGFWSNYLIQMRPYLFYISGVAGLAGMALFADFDFLSVQAILCFIAVFFSYGFGQALTDCYQIDTDSISAPYRPLSKGILTPGVVKIVSVTGLVTVIGILIFYNLWNLVLGLFGILGLWAYSFVKRRMWFAGPPLNAFIVVLLAVMGYLAISGQSILSFGGTQMMAMAGLTFFSYINFVLIGYLKDITADKETGYRTFPVEFGWNRSVWLGDLNVIMCALMFWVLGINAYSAVLGALALIIAISGQLYAHFVREKKEENSAYPVISTVRSFILWHLGVVVGFVPELIIFSIVFYILFEITIYFRPMHAQI
jgi:4-hydroxybenzoate polyprenyltransferase